MHELNIRHFLFSQVLKRLAFFDNRVPVFQQGPGFSTWSWFSNRVLVFQQIPVFQQGPSFSNFPLDPQQLDSGQVDMELQHWPSSFLYLKAVEISTILPHY